MLQTKKQMLIETLVNTVIGFIGAWLITHIMLLKFSNTVWLSIGITTVCTIWSLLRGFYIRHMFNHYRHRRVAYQHIGSGRIYYIVGETNQSSTRDDFPPTTIYTSGETMWSRPTAEFNEKFIRLN